MSIEPIQVIIITHTGDYETETRAYNFIAADEGQRNMLLENNHEVMPCSICDMIVSEGELVEEVSIFPGAPFTFLHCLIA